jgi:uncharacterized Zn-finger protein
MFDRRKWTDTLESNFSLIFAELGLWSNHQYSRRFSHGKTSVFEPPDEALQDAGLSQHRELRQQPDLTGIFGSLQSSSVRRQYVTNSQHPNEGFVCPSCGKIYRWKKSLYNHVKLECGKEPQFQCPHCPHRAKLNWNLQKHIKLKHPQDNM